MDASGLPEGHNVGIDPGAPHRDKFDAGSLRKSENVFWGPVADVGVESVNQGFPGVGIHDVVEHFWEVDLGNDTIEELLVNSAGSGDDFGKLIFGVSLIGGFNIGDNVSIRIFF